MSLKQTGFGGGIIGPQLRGKSNQEKYQTGLQECRNWVVTRFGSVENRAGTGFIGEIKDSSLTVREVPFIFNANISYDLEFGNLYVRPWKQGSRISVVGAAAYAGGTTYAIGDLVTSVGIVYYSIQAGNIGHTPASSAAYWYVQAGGLLEIPTNLATAALRTFQYVQQNDVMTVAHQSILPQQLIRYSDTKWAWQAFTQSTGILPPATVFLAIGVGAPAVPTAPTGLVAGGGGSGIVGGYFISSFNSNGEGPATVVPVASDMGTVGFPVNLSWTPVAGADGYIVYFQDAAVTFPAAIVGITTSAAFDDVGWALWQFTASIRVPNFFASGGISFTYAVTAVDATTGAESLLVGQTPATATGGTPTDANPNVISWTSVANAASYNIYRLVAGAYGFIGSAVAPVLSFSDPNILPDTNIQPPTALALFLTSSDYPAVVSYYQQRLTFANTVNEPQTVEASNVGNYSNFAVGVPVTDDAAVQFTIAGKQVQEVRAIVDLGKMIIHTSGDEYVATGNQAGALTPTAISLVHQGSAGCSTIPPLVIGNIGIFIQARGSILRELEYSIYTTSFKGRDLTVFAPHLFVGRTIVDMAWQQIPDSIIWCVMSDGALLGLTYIKDHDIWAWHRHDTDGGLFENVVVVPEATEDVVYFVVKRTINGSVKRYIERLYSRTFTSIVDAKFVDCGLTYDGRNAGSTTMLVTTGGGWTPQDDLTITSSVPYFVAGDVGNAIVFQEIADGSQQDSAGNRYAPGTVIDTCTFDIIASISLTQMTVQAERDVPTWARVALATWGKAVHQFTGIGHLEGETLSGLGDGNVIPQVTVAGGAFATTDNYMVLTVGLPITADLETLPIENQQGDTISNKKVVVQELTPIFYSSRGGQYGQDFAHLKDWVQRAGENWDVPTNMRTGPSRIPVAGAWQVTGQICVRQADPLPIGLSAIVVTGQVGNN